MGILGGFLLARQSLLAYLSTISDPRINRTKKHRLDDILMITLIGVIGGATSPQTIHAYAKCREAWLLTFLQLPNGIPSHDTIYRVLCALNPKTFVTCFGQWVAEWSETMGLKHIAVDGKSLRNASSNTFSGCVHQVGAWATEQGLILGQESVPELGNELTAIPDLLRALHLEGALVTLDAIGCQQKIVEQIREQKGDYLITVKKNQRNLHAAVKQIFTEACNTDFAGVTYSHHSSMDDKHGRLDERHVVVIEDPQGLPAGWKDVVAVVPGEP